MNIVTTRAARHSFSLPNDLTYARIAAIPVVVGCIYAQAVMDGPLWLRWVAVAVFIAAGITDFLDGYYARIWHQHSAFGRMLDPIADKLLVASCLLMLAADGIIHGWTLWAAIVILCREILVSGLREYLAALRVSVPVTKLAKWKTTVQLVAIGFLLAGEAGDQVIPITTRPVCCCCGSPRFSPSIPAGTISAPASITSSRRMRDEGQVFRLGARTGRQIRGNGRAAGKRSHRGRSDSVAGGARRDIRSRLRDAAGDSCRDRPRPRQIGYHDCRRPRDRLLPADDRRLEHDPEKWEPVFRKDHAPIKLRAVSPALRCSHDRRCDHPYSASRFRHRAGDIRAHARAHRYRCRREFQRHLPGPRRLRDHRGADARTLSRDGGG